LERTDVGLAPRNVEGQSDDWLVAAVRRDPPDEVALQALVDRYWKPLFARCRLLTQDADVASDLANETWYRILRARRSLDPSKSFRGYLITIASNLWRDWNRAARHGSSMSLGRAQSLDAQLPSDDGTPLTFGDLLPDPASLDAEGQAHLKLDLDEALARLSPQLRDVLAARFVDGESAAEIGRRYGRTEQTVTSWVRQASRMLAQSLGASDRRAGGRT
jgi:RNA polymerase sigma factor (sigma-70 family)